MSSGIWTHAAVLACPDAASELSNEAIRITGPSQSDSGVTDREPHECCELPQPWDECDGVAAQVVGPGEDAMA